MGDPAQPRKSGIGRWIFLGCAGCGGLVLLSFAGCAGLLYWAYKGSEPIANVGATYLVNAPELAESMGTPLTVKRAPMNWKVSLSGGSGDARIGYTLRGPKGWGNASVWLTQNEGTWTATGARVGREAAHLFDIGQPPRIRMRGVYDWDD